MTRGPSYYDLFGLKQNASAREIRASYLRLLKQHHPDRVQAGEPRARPDLVPLLNRCYSILRDPKKRAAYDATLVSRVATPLAQLTHPSKHMAASWPARRSMLAAAVIMGGVSLLCLVLLQQVAPPRLLETEGRLTWPKSNSSTSRLAPEEIRRQAHLARSVSDQRAVEMSQQCFADARRDQKLASAELCILFDQAFLYWRKAPGDLAFLPIYYNDQVMQIRHMGALTGLRQQEIDARLANLRENAFRALLQDVSGSQQTIIEGAAATGQAQNIAADEVQLTPPVSK